MKQTHRKWLIIPLFAALIVWLIFLKPSPYWEVRATVSVRGEAAGTVPELLESAFFSRHLREISDFDGSISASAIPGTQLVEIALREDSQAYALAGMNAALNRLPAVMDYFSADFSMDILLKPQLREQTARPDYTPWLLAGAAGLLLILPAPKFRAEWDLADLLRSFGRLTKRLWILALVLCLGVTGGYYVYQRAVCIPVFQAGSVVSLGEYDAKTVSQLPATVQGLLSCDFLTRHLESDCRISAEAAAESNLFTLTAAAPTPEAAQAALDAMIAHWPELFPYANDDLTMTIHEIIPSVSLPVNPFRPAAALFRGVLLALLCWTVFALALLLFRQNIDTAACKAYNESQS